MKTNLYGFSTQSFEQFIQSLSIHVLGPGISIFGSGPDGGREATFQETASFPSSQHRWDSYGIIQAKYKEKPEDTGKQQTWVLSHIKSELDTLAKRKKQLRPKYYVFATNVVLTPALVSGGKDKAENLIKSYYRKLGLIDHRVWDGDQIEGFLNAYGELRERFSIQLTAGDLLSSVTNFIKHSIPNIETSAANYLDRTLRADEDARLDQAGQKIDRRTALAQVFVDLAASPSPYAGQDYDAVDPDNDGNDFLKGILTLGSLKLDPISLDHQQQPQTAGELPLWTCANRWVLIGGPGSGKSTLGQFLSQIYRASLLDRRPPHSLTPESREIIRQVREMCETDKLPWPSTPRFPFRIELSSFARSLASNEADHRVMSLIDYLSNKLRLANGPSHSVLGWMKHMPMLLILDGLDEVPPSSNRDAVCTTIQDFFSEAAHANIDLLTIATTRPSGYNNEFGRDKFEYRYLQPLTTKKILLYATRFARARYGPGSPKVVDMEHRIKEAADDQLTARLMHTPLQVTFMATLIAAGGRPPKDRWKLFHDYYDTIYKREQQKAEGDLRSVLEKHDSIIHRVHHDVGFLLQVHSENTGETDAMMPTDIFTKRVRQYLIDNGWEEPDLSSIIKCISEEARTRLVFLTSRVANHISFDVRSLQEYMAAECIMTCTDTLLTKRLRTIGPLEYWRNVFLFAAGECFSQPSKEHFRSDIVQICSELNDFENDETLATAKVGSWIALDLLEDGTVSNSPIFGRSFAGLALELLKLPHSSYHHEARTPLHVRLTSVYDNQTDRVYKEFFLNTIRPIPQHAGHYWGVLFGLSNRNVHWASDFIDSGWYTILDDQVTVLETALLGNTNSRRTLDILERIAPHVSPRSLSKVPFNRNTPNTPRWLASAFASCRQPFRVEKAKLAIPHLNKAFFEAEFVPLFSSNLVRAYSESKDLGDMPNPNSYWRFMHAVQRFVQDPSKEYLATCIEMSAAFSEDSNGIRYQTLPWLLSTCLAHCAKRLDHVRIAASARSGALGEAEDWEEAERRWTREGITVHDIVHSSTCQLPLDDNIAKVGFPWFSWLEVNGAGDTGAALFSLLLEGFERESDVQCKSLYKRLIHHLLSEFQRKSSERIRTPCLTLLSQLFEPPLSIGLCISCLLAFDWQVAMDDRWIDFFDEIGQRQRGPQSLYTATISTRLPELLSAALTLRPEKAGILTLLALFARLKHRFLFNPLLIDLRKLDTPHKKLCGIALILSQKQEQIDNDLVKSIVHIEANVPQLQALSTAIQVLRNGETSDKIVEHFLVSLYKEAAVKTPDRTHLCIDSLIVLARGRNSFLRDQSTADRFSLPWEPRQSTGPTSGDEL